MIVDKKAIWITNGAVLFNSPTNGIDVFWNTKGSFILDGVNEGIAEGLCTGSGGGVVGGSAVITSSGGILSNKFEASGGGIVGGGAVFSSGTFRIGTCVAAGGGVVGGTAICMATLVDPPPSYPNTFVNM